MTDQFTSLPTEIILHCISFMPVSSILKLSQLNSTFNTILSDEGVWKHLFERDRLSLMTNVNRPTYKAKYRDVAKQFRFLLNDAALSVIRCNIFFNDILRTWHLNSGFGTKLDMYASSDNTCSYLILGMMYKFNTESVRQLHDYLVKDGYSPEITDSHDELVLHGSIINGVWEPRKRTDPLWLYLDEKLSTN